MFAVIEPGGSLKLPSAFGLHDGWRYEAEKVWLARKSTCSPRMLLDCASCLDVFNGDPLVEKIAGQRMCWANRWKSEAASNAFCSKRR